MKTAINTVAMMGVALLALGLSACGGRQVMEPADYANPDLWLCLPGREDACNTDLTATVVAADGRMTEQAWQPASEPAIDCFYVYPTVSRDSGIYSDLQAGPEEAAVAQVQFARFASQCRLFAPLYRQVSLTGLRTRLATGAEVNTDSGYGDVKAAWQHYLRHHNEGRGVVLVGHSQGTMMLTRLLQEEIEQGPQRSQLVSALLIGGDIQVDRRDGAVAHSTFQQLPLCRRDNQFGCVVAYTSFRADAPPTDGGLFGRADEQSISACVNPARLVSGGTGLNSYLATGDAGYSAKAPPPEWVPGQTQPETPFVALPGLLRGECVLDRHGSYLAIEVLADPEDPRTDQIHGDLILNGEPVQSWGLHLIDMDLGMGDLLTLVERQARAWQAARQD